LTTCGWPGGQTFPFRQCWGCWLGVVTPRAGSSACMLPLTLTPGWLWSRFAGLRADNFACGQACCPPAPSASRDGSRNPSRTSLLVTLFGDLAAYLTLSGSFVVFRSLGGSMRGLGCCSCHLGRHLGCPPHPGCMCLGARFLLLSPSTSSWLSSAALVHVPCGLVSAACHLRRHHGCLSHRGWWYLLAWLSVNLTLGGWEWLIWDAHST